MQSIRTNINDDIGVNAMSIAGIQGKWQAAYSLSKQRERLGLSLLACAFLLHVHESTLMDVENGVALPSEDMATRLELLGLSHVISMVNRDVDCVLDLERLVYRKILALSADVRACLMASLGFYLSSKRMLNEDIRRDLVLTTLLHQSGQWSPMGRGE
jgi:hypothetical protein